MKAILDFIASNRVVTIILAAIIVIAVAMLIIVSAKKKQKKRDKAYADMFKEVPIVNDDSEESNVGENRPEFAVHEMDWLKGERGFEGVLRTKLPPLKAQPETSAIKAKSTENSDADAIEQNAVTATNETVKPEKKQKKSSKKAEKEARKRTEANGNEETFAAASTQLSIDDITEKNAAEPDVDVITDASEIAENENDKEGNMK